MTAAAGAAGARFGAGAVTGVDVRSVGEGVVEGFVNRVETTNLATGTDAIQTCSGELGKGQGSGCRLGGEEGVNKANVAVEAGKHDVDTPV